MFLRRLLLSLIILYISTSCKSDDESSSVLITKADITGSVNLYDEGTTQIDNSNMLVKIEGITPEISALTDNNGDFILYDVPFGNYTIVYEKEGFGKFKRFDLVHENTLTVIPNTPSIGKTSTTHITNLQVNTIDEDIVVSITTDPSGNLGNTRYIRYFLSTDSNVNNENFTYFSPGLISQINPKEITLSVDDLSSAGFSSGETVYVKVYGDSFFSNKYYNPNLERYIFPNLNITTVNALSFVIP